MSNRLSSSHRTNDRGGEIKFQPCRAGNNCSIPPVKAMLRGVVRRNLRRTSPRFSHDQEELAQMSSASQPRRRPKMTLLVIADVILFAGAVASNLVANYIQPSLDPYKKWVWAGFFIALAATIALRIRESRREADSANEPQASITQSGSRNVVAQGNQNAS